MHAYLKLIFIQPCPLSPNPNPALQEQGRAGESPGLLVRHLHAVQHLGARGGGGPDE